MKTSGKRRITLALQDLELILALQSRLEVKSKVEVIRRGLRLLEETTDRASLREAYRQASLATRGALVAELEEIDRLAGDGLGRS